MGTAETQIVGLVLLGLIPAAVAAHKGRSFLAWWLYGTLLFIVALPHAILTSPGARPGPQAARDVLVAVESKPGMDQVELSTRAAVPMPQVITALTELHGKGLVALQTVDGPQVEVARGRTVPRVVAHPAPDPTGG